MGSRRCDLDHSDHRQAGKSAALGKNHGGIAASQAQRLQAWATARQYREGVTHNTVAKGEGELNSKIVVMVDSARIREFWERWQQTPNPSEEFVKFRRRMIEVGNAIWDNYFEGDISLRKKFAVVSGTECTEYKTYPHGGLYKALKNTDTEFKVIAVTQSLLWAMELESPFGLDYCCRKIKEALDLSPTIMIQLVQHDKTATLYPTGVRMLDETLVESNIAWLGRYPKAAKAFEDALRAYMTKNPHQYRAMLDSLRFAVEQMLQAILNNGRTLENQKEDFLRWLKNHDAHNQIGGMYHNLLFGYFAKYQNDAVKHQEDQYTPAEVEFVLYLTGTFLRFIQQLIEQETASRTS